MAHTHNKDLDLENRARIREILMQKWDPIGISGIGPDGEYDSYINTIYLMLFDKRTNQQRITNHLLGLAVNAMGLSDKPRLREKCILAAAALLALRPEL
jgi:hypothetical protein